MTALWVIIVILVLIIIGAGIWYYWKHKRDKGGEIDPGELDMAPIAPDSPGADEAMYNNPEGDQFDVTTAPRDGLWTGSKPNKPVPLPPKKKENDNDNQGRQIILSDEAESEDNDVDMMAHKISVVETEDVQQYKDELGRDPIDDIDVFSDGDVVGDINTMTGE